MERATALAASCADGDARTCDLDIAVVVAVETFLWRTFRGVCEYSPVADGDGSRASIVGIHGIVAIGVTHRCTTVEVDGSAGVDAVVITCEIVFATLDVNTCLRL